jgi:hypothetical protein
LEEKAMRRNLKRKNIVMFFIIVICLVIKQSLAIEFAGGTGEPNNPYQIATAEQLQAIGDSTLEDKCFILVADIDLDPNLPGNEIVVDRSFISFFSGTLDGNGHSISNLVIGIYSNAPGGPRTGLGLIGFLSRDGIIKDILLRNITICGVGHQVGALVGSNYGTVLRCSATGNISGVFGVGGLVGRNGGSIVSCSAFCNVVQGETVAGGAVAGGLVGDNFGYIYNCYATGTVTGKGALGGLVGINYDGMSNCYATGTVTGEESVGGLVGANYADTVSQCYAASKIITDSNDSIGGLIGESIGQTTNSFWDIQVSGLKTSASGIGLPTLKLQDSATYLNAGWDMAGETSNGVADFWTIMEPNTYPQLTRLTEQYTVKQLPGSGTPYDPYEIATAADLVAINDYDINAHYILVADIDMSGIVWATAPILFFNGTFDGRGNTISNLTIKGSDYLGLFGKIRHRAVVTNLTIQDAYIIGNECVGALAGQSIGQITNCHVTGNVTGVSYVGGLVGLVYGATFEETISDCTADVALSGNDNIHNIANARYFD